jgi:hypothetical protein
MDQLDEQLLMRAFAPARELAESDVAVLGALAAARPHRRWWRRRWVLLAAAVVVLVPASAVAIHEITAEPGSAGDAFTNYLEGVHPDTWPGIPYEGDPPARSRVGGPSRMLVDDYVEPRILARRGPVGLYVARTEDGEGLLFEMPGVGIGMGRDELFEAASRDVLPLRGGTDDAFLRRGVFPLFGLVDADIAAVRVIYRDGPPSPPVDADGGFVVLVDPKRWPKRVQGLDTEGRVIGEAAAGKGWEDDLRQIYQYRQEQARLGSPGW